MPIRETISVASTSASRALRRLYGPETPRELVETLSRSRGSPLPQPAMSALGVRAQKLHQLRRRGLHGDVGRCRAALSRPSSAIESNGVTAILAEVDERQP